MKLSLSGGYTWFIAEHYLCRNTIQLVNGVTYIHWTSLRSPLVNSAMPLIGISSPVSSRMGTAISYRPPRRVVPYFPSLYIGTTHIMDARLSLTPNFIYLPLTVFFFRWGMNVSDHKNSVVIYFIVWSIPVHDPLVIQYQFSGRGRD